jgi:hypothetical protein
MKMRHKVYMNGRKEGGGGRVTWRYFDDRVGVKKLRGSTTRE